MTFNLLDLVSTVLVWHLMHQLACPQTILIQSGSQRTEQYCYILTQMSTTSTKYLQKLTFFKKGVSEQKILLEAVSRARGEQKRTFF